MFKHCCVVVPLYRLTGQTKAVGRSSMPRINVQKDSPFNFINR